MSIAMTPVVEITAFRTQHVGTPGEVVGRLVAMGWEVEESLLDRTTLIHDLIPGARRIVIHT